MTWRNVWTATTRYKKGDVVRYGGQVYICNTGHTAAATDALGLEANQASWDYVHKGIEYLGEWTTATRYKINDVVKYGGDIWICTTYPFCNNYTCSRRSKLVQFQRFRI